MLLTMTQGAWAQGSGDGSSELTPIVISSIADLNQLSLNVRAKNSVGYLGKYIELKSDLDFSEVDLFDTNNDGVPDSNFQPIGYSDENENSPFRGIFNGGGHTIKGITVNRPDVDYIGLFGLIEGDTIKNLRIKGGTIRNLRIEDCTFVGNTCVGAVVGLSNTRIEGSEPNDAAKGVDPSDELPANNIEPSSCSISDCYVADNVSVKANSIAGGIFGYAYWTTASNCVSAASVEAVSSVGSIGGQMDNDGSFSMELTDCYYTGGSNLKIYGAGTGFMNLSLLDDDSQAQVPNDTRIRNYVGEVVNVTLTDRIFYFDGDWNTLCLPFDLFLGELEALDVRALTKAGFSEEDGALTLEFTPALGKTGAVEKLKAGVPYLVKWDNTGDEYENPYFVDVSIVEASPKPITSNGVSFVGTYGTVQFPGATPNVLYLGVENQLFYPKSAMNFNAFRAYFELDETLFGAGSPNNIREFRLDFGGETDIQKVLADERAAADSDAWYTLDGRRLAGKPAAKGIYLKGGKTICITE